MQRVWSRDFIGANIWEFLAPGALGERIALNDVRLKVRVEVYDVEGKEHFGVAGWEVESNIATNLHKGCTYRIWVGEFHGTCMVSSVRDETENIKARVLLIGTGKLEGFDVFKRFT